MEPSLSSTQVKSWAETIKARELTEIAVPLVAFLQVWGFVGGQLLWMLAPFVGEHTIAPYALALEQPDTLHQLHHYLVEEGA